MTAAMILSVDDNPDDLMLLGLACAAIKVSFQLRTAESGDKAIEYLRAAIRGNHREEYPLPDCMLLDLKMPGKSGFDVLTWIRAQPGLGELPVLVFTSSIHAEDRARALSLGASHFLVKPASYEGFQQLARALENLAQGKKAPNLEALLTTLGAELSPPP